jgi:hypothetical protein
MRKLAPIPFSVARSNLKTRSSPANNEDRPNVFDARMAGRAWPPVVCSSSL